MEPDLLVKGGDYRIEDIVGYREVISRGGRVITIPLLEGYSTTSIINRNSFTFPFFPKASVDRRDVLEASWHFFAQQNKHLAKEYSLLFPTFMLSFINGKDKNCLRVPELRD